MTPEDRTTNKQYLMKGKAAAPQKEMVNLMKAPYRWMKTFATSMCGRSIPTVHEELKLNKTTNSGVENCTVLKN